MAVRVRMARSTVLALAAIALLAIAASAQTSPARIPPDVAEKRLIKAPPPKYPGVAEAARIQGNVILEIRIDETGRASVHRLVTGHPLLAPAAIEAVNQWTYQPFEVDGKPAAVVTVVQVAFGNAAYYAAQGRTELAFQNDFWTAEESAEAALAKGDYVRTEEELNKEKGVLSPDSKDTWHIQERWQSMTTAGQLRMVQQKHEEAEQYFKDALALRQNNWEDKNSPQIAASLANLATLYEEEKKNDLAHDYAARSLAMFEKNFKKAGSGNPGARQVYGRAVVHESWMVLRLAKEQGDVTETKRQCNTLLEFQSFIDAADRGAVASACELASTNGSKPR